MWRQLQAYKRESDAAVEEAREAHATKERSDRHLDLLLKSLATVSGLVPRTAIGSERRTSPSYTTRSAWPCGSSTLRKPLKENFPVCRHYWRIYLMLGY